MTNAARHGKGKVLGRAFCVRLRFVGVFTHSLGMSLRVAEPLRGWCQRETKPPNLGAMLTLA